MSSGIIPIIKEAAIKAIEDSTPSNIVIGVVTSDAPLKIQISKELTLNYEDGVLLLCERVTEHKYEVTVEWKTEKIDPHSHSTPHGESGTAGEHLHDIVGKKEITVHRKLKKGEKVLVCRTQGGQKFIVLDRLGEVK